MDPQLMDFIREDTPPINMDLGRGVAFRHMSQSLNYIDSLWRAASKGMPEGFQYLGAVPCTAEEEWNFRTRRVQRKGRRKPGVRQGPEYNIAQTDTFLMKYRFMFKGEEFFININIPFVRLGGLMWLNGTCHLISPVLADVLIEYHEYEIFVIFNKAKISFKKFSNSFMADGVKVERSQPYAEKLHHKKPKVTLTVRPKPTLFHYLLCKYGFENTFKIHGRAEVKAINIADFNQEDWPNEEWVYCRSAHILKKPTSYQPHDWEPPKIMLLVRRRDFEGEYGERIQRMVAGFFHIVDHFPQRILAEYVNSPRLWPTLLGKVLWGDSEREADQHDQILNHIESLDGYVDPIVRNKFKRLNLKVENIFDFFLILIDRFTDILQANRANINSMYGKEFSVMYYMFYDLMRQINEYHFRIWAGRNNELTKQDLENNLKKFIRPGFIHRTAKESGIFSTASSPNGNMALRMTAIMVPQDQSSRLHRGETRTMNPRKKLHISGIEVGGFCNMPKSNPNAHARSNPRVLTDNTGAVVRNEEFRTLLDSVQPRLTTQMNTENRTDAADDTEE